tara:strand:+ start:371 stop:517 length:147 start_codon:yes stop_codon:yes gene_type:complete
MGIPFQENVDGKNIRKQLSDDFWNISKLHLHTGADGKKTRSYQHIEGI